MMSIRELHLHPRFNFADAADAARYVFRSLFHSLEEQARYRRGHFGDFARKGMMVIWG
jgi:hypothetical protein